MTEQLYFPDFQRAVAATARPARLRLLVGSMSAEGFTAALTLALACENVAFTTYSIMLRARAGDSICDISETLNLSYHTIVHQAERTPYFAFDRSGERVRLGLNAEGFAKTERIAKRLTKRKP
jgi:hypothetical protein